MDLQPRTVLTQAVAKVDWLFSRHGTEATDTITLDLTTFTAGTHYVAADGYIPAGTPIVKDGTTNLYKPVASNATTCDGHLFREVPVNSGQTKAGAALLWHGEVVLAKLPTFAPNARAAHVRYV
jgi:hypothetical protein